MAGSHCMFFKKQAIEVTMSSTSFNLNVTGAILEFEWQWDRKIVVLLEDQGPIYGFISGVGIQV